MPKPDLTEEDYSDLAALVREAIDGERLPPRVRRLKSILAKVDSASAKPAVATHPAPRPTGEPSLLYEKLRGGRRRR